MRTKLRKRLIDHVKELLKDEVAASYFTPRQVIQIRETLRDDILTIGFARRFATYKRAHLLFRNLERLDEDVYKRQVWKSYGAKMKAVLKAYRDGINEYVKMVDNGLIWADEPGKALTWMDAVSYTHLF